MRTPVFWLLSMGHSMALLTVGAVSLHLVPHIMESVGLTITAASGAVSVMTLFNILGQVGGGFLGDRFSKRMLCAIAMLMHGSALLILAYATTIMPVFIFAVLHGTAWGLRGPMMTTIRADYFGRASFATIMGFSSLVVMVGMTGGPLFAGYMADIFDGYRVPLHNHRRDNGPWVGFLRHIRPSQAARQTPQLANPYGGRGLRPLLPLLNSPPAETLT